MLRLEVGVNSLTLSHPCPRRLAAPFDHLEAAAHATACLDPPALQCERLPVFWKQQRMQFFDAVSFMIPATLQRIPFSLTEGFVWTVLTYWAVGLAGETGR